MKIKYNRFYYNPLPEEVEIKKSDIHGHGIFAKEDIDKEVDLGSTHIKVPMIVGYIRTPIGGFLNHSDNNNCYLEEQLDWDDYRAFNVFTGRDIKKGEELTLDYHGDGLEYNIEDL